MKKYLIALPLVLIMILSMVPVMAANKPLSVPVTYFKNPQKSESFPKETRTVYVDEAVLTDAAKLKAAVEAEVRAMGFPKLDSEAQPEWIVEATVTAYSKGEDTYSAITQTSQPTLAELKGLNANVIFDESALKTKPAGTEKVAAPLATKYNAAIDAIVKGNGTASEADRTVKLADGDLVAADGEPADVTIKTVVVTAGEVTEAAASAEAYPKCIVDPKAPKKTWCPELCEFITVKVVNAHTGAEIKSAMHKYKVDPKKIPTFSAIYNHFMDNFFPLDYQVLKDWNLRDKINFPTAVEDDCTIVIYALPLFQKVDVYHILQDCCINLDGKVEYKVWKVFEELNQSVPFIDYHTDLVINHEKAKDYAATRLQKINATDFVFVKAVFDDGIRLDGYMTGEVYDMDGNKVAQISNTNPVISLIYHRVGCDKEEEKVDNATVENNANTQAPVTASGTQLPATGAKDVTAFFLSAVALLGLGIFFAKKH